MQHHTEGRDPVCLFSVNLSAVTLDVPLCHMTNACSLHHVTVASELHSQGGHDSQALASLSR